MRNSMHIAKEKQFSRSYKNKETVALFLVSSRKWSDLFLLEVVFGESRWRQLVFKHTIDENGFDY